MLKIIPSSICTLIIALFGLTACTPQYDWREVRGASAPFVILLPAKPASFSRSVNLDGQQVTMTMTAAEVDGVTYAVGAATLPDFEKARAALVSMSTALVKNIGGTVDAQKSHAASPPPTAQIDVDAIGPPTASSNGQPVRLVARFVAKDKQVYQVVVVGRDKAITPEALDTFFTSFKLN